MKWLSLLRNVCVALGNTSNASALPHLQKVAKDSEPLIAEHARWAVERIPAGWFEVMTRVQFCGLAARCHQIRQAGMPAATLLKGRAGQVTAIGHTAAD